MENFLEKMGIVDSEDRIRGIIEGILFTAGDAVSLKDISEVTDIGEKQIRQILKRMAEDYRNESRGIILLEFNGKVQLASKPDYGEYIKRFIRPEGRQYLSQAALETLSIIAYKQPITKAEIDEIRGVRSDRAVSTLLEKNLIKESGRLDTTGRPILYSTTDDFLKYFGFKNIKELPELIEFNMDFVEE